MATATDTQILTLTQWLSPAFPVGSYAYSHGLEWLVETGEVHDTATLSDWLRDVIQHGAGRADILFLAAAYSASTPDALLDVDAQACAFAGSAERRKETVLQGQAFSRTIADVWCAGMPKLTYPVAVGWAALEQDLSALASASVLSDIAAMKHETQYSRIFRT